MIKVARTVVNGDGFPLTYQLMAAISRNSGANQSPPFTCAARTGWTKFMMMTATMGRKNSSSTNPGRGIGISPNSRLPGMSRK